MTETKPPKRASRKAEQRAEMIEQILDVAEELFSRHGLNGVTLNDVAVRVGVHRTLLSYYFKDKKELFDQVFARRAELVRRQPRRRRPRLGRRRILLALDVRQQPLPLLDDRRLRPRRRGVRLSPPLPPRVEHVREDVRAEREEGEEHGDDGAQGADPWVEDELHANDLRLQGH